MRAREADVVPTWTLAAALAPVEADLRDPSVGDTKRKNEPHRGNLTAVRLGLAISPELEKDGGRAGVVVAWY